MKKIFLGLLLFVFGCLGLQASEAYQIKADAQTKRIPIGTKLTLEAASAITTASLGKGDMLSAHVVNDVLVDGDLVIPKGTIVRGNVSEVVGAKRLSRGAILYVNFDHIVAPNGKQLPLKAGISSDFKLTDDGGINAGGNYGSALAENFRKTGKIISRTTKWGVSSGEELFHGGKFLITPFAAVGGTIAGGGYLIGDSIIDLFRKGKEVMISKGQKFNITLIEPLDVPVF